MEWMERMNRTMDYIEENLSGRIDPEQIARIMACPYAVFQRGFGPIAGVQLAEYIRRRRLSCAAYDLQHTSLRVIDVAVKYGYDSADAFAVAFRRMHGLTPQEARKPGAKLSFYPRLTFSLRIVGTEKMRYEVCELPAFSVLGIRRTTPWGGGTWGVIKQNGQIHDIERVCGQACDLGLCFGFAEDGSNDYFCGALRGPGCAGLRPHRAAGGALAEVLCGGQNFSRRAGRNLEAHLRRVHAAERVLPDRPAHHRVIRPLG